ncbi:tyrosine-type recombinase/integrase [Sulfurovum sp.]|jgi:integrase/recombinase XerC|uniref:tyrosine-type recombinase/integrase n=1 Tax=Sulfurovum sp. TaxID=1969726 RepID=UPI002A35B181|nr:tyrosine-type recombinase/integrase [Sulfurovum sp.]MDD2450537.1 tyrosine-type recombinase/integrase [Sulfurovum sp.]MDD3500372.1 tyrosine-type recombinase/integrase [Sulfurovum sp.]MDY0403919.1 tyrosine-type recombinase/integrase [Sulfurovum sp.]
MKKKLQKLADIFLDYLTDIRGYSEATVSTYEIALRQMMEVSHFYEEEDTLVLDITPYRFGIAKKNRHTIAARLTAIHSFARYLEEQKNLRIRLIAGDSVKVPKNLPKPIEAHYIREVLQSAALPDRLLITLLYGLGLRITELSTLQLSQIQREWVQVRGKGNKVRELPLLPMIREMIETYTDAYAPKKYLFEKGNVPLNSAQLRYRLTKIFKAHGIKATPHQLRHSFATHLLNEGARISDVSELLGHATMATTQVYTKLGTAKKKDEYMKAHPLVKSEE